MQFENPLILYFLSLLIVPIAIHLFNLRKYKKVFFSNLYSLKNIEKESLKMREIKKWMILFSRLLLISILILAFAKPHIKTKNIYNQNNYFSIYIDNSLSMDIKSADTNKKLIEEAKDIALQIINNLNEEQKINIITNDYSFNNEKFQSKEKAIEIIKQIEISPFNTKICDILIRQNNLKDNLYKFIISDFDNNFISNTNCNITDDKKLEIIKIKGSNKNNISINSCEFENYFHKKGQTEKLIVELENHGEEKQEGIQFELYIDGSQRGIFSVDIEGKSKIQEPINIINTKNGSRYGKIELINEDDFNFDNSLFFSYEIKEKIKILCISESNITQELSEVFNEPIFELKTFKKDQIKVSEIKNYDLIILDHLEEIPNGLNFDLNKSLENKNNILIFPPKKINIESYNNLLESYNIDKISKWKETESKQGVIDTTHWVFNGVFKNPEKNMDFPLVNGYFEIEKNNLKNLSNPILKLLNNDFFFAEFERKSGKIFLCTSPINSNYTNFSEHAIFLPIMHNICRKENAKNLYYQIEKNLNVPTSNFLSENYIPIIKYFVDGIEKKSFIPSLKKTENDMYLKLENNISKSGNYEICIKSQSEINCKKKLSLNYKREEGNVNLNKANNKDLLNLGLILDNYNKNNIVKKNAIELSFYLIIIAIFLFLTELLLLKFWKQ